jgi:HlyD family secretion protein
MRCRDVRHEGFRHEAPASRSTQPMRLAPRSATAYRVETRIVLWEAPNVLKVPTNALFRDNARWAVYVVSGGRARRTIVEIGHQTSQEAEVLEGLTEGAIVVVHPGDLVRDGGRIASR